MSATALWKAESAASILANYDIETSDRRAALERACQAALAVFQRKAAKEIAEFSRLSDTLTVGELAKLYGWSTSAAASSQTAANAHQPLKEPVREGEDDILQTAKKRKRQLTARTGESTSQNNDDEHSSPTKPSKNMRMTSTGAGSRTAFNASGSVYRARPSHVPYGQLNPRLPQTPHIGSTSSRGAAGSRMTATQRRRLPKRNESIQAYSMNGSPLGILELDLEQKRGGGPSSRQISASSSAAPTSEADHPVSQGDGDWELLHRQPLVPTSGRVSTVQQQYKAHQQRSLSPHKPTLGSVSGSMKAAFASKFGHPSAGISPSKQQFTMHMPSAPPAQGKKDWEAWSEAFKRDLGKMSGLSAQDKKVLEDRLKQMGLS